MEVAATLSNILRVCPVRIMAKEDFHSSHQVAFSSVHGEEAAAINADGMEERDMDMRKDAMRPASTCREEQQYNYGNRAVPSLPYHLSYPNPTSNARLSVSEENPASTSSSAAPRSPPLSVLTNNMRLESHGQSGLCTDKFSAPSPAPPIGNECQASSPAKNLRAFSPLKQIQASSPSSWGHLAASSLLQASPPVKQSSSLLQPSPPSKQSSSPPKQSQASVPSRQPSPPEESKGLPLQAPSLKHSQGSSAAKDFPSKDQTQAFSLLLSPLHHQQVLAPLSQPYTQGSITGKQAEVVLDLSSAQLNLPAIQGNSKKRPRSSAVRDFPEGCGKNGFSNANIATKQSREEQKLGAVGEALPYPRHPVLMTKDDTALCLYKSQKMSTLLLQTPKAHLSLKWKEARSPMDRKKPKVRHLSRMLSSAEERTFQLEWVKEGEHEHFACAERLVMLQDGLSLIERLSTHSNGSIPAERLPQPLEGLENLLPIEGNSGASARSLVKRTLQGFDCVRRSLAMTRDRHQRPDLAAAKILRSKGMWRNYGERKIVGDVPGVEVGDQFNFRIAMLIIGLHRQVQGGIDYISGAVRGKGPLAVSIVASGGYEDDDDCGTTFIYTGQGGNNYKGDRRQASDQVLKRGNLALSNSFKEKSPVRVIRGSTDDKLYTYDGLYDVVDCWFQTGASGFGVFQVKLSRRPGQPELGSSLVKFMGTAKKKGLIRPHLLLADISAGKERLPICVVNEVDEEPAPQVFTYVRKMKYPSWCHPELSRGCDCVGGCVDASKCLCAAKNGGEFPYNEFGQIVRGKKLLFECGKSCPCPSSCYNRVSQKGPTSKLEVFKTKRRGWGVRSWDSIKPGGFICEYVGELLSDSDAERRTGCDEYLFDIGNMMSWSDASGLMDTSNEKAIVPVVEDAGFTIDARLFGNVARFINHSCSPNLFAQNVVCDSDDLRFPHVMLFSMENIPPMRELSYDYNYTIGHVNDANGNVKCKACYCGAQDCRGRLY